MPVSKNPFSRTGLSLSSGLSAFPLRPHLGLPENGVVAGCIGITAGRKDVFKDGRIESFEAFVVLSVVFTE